MNKPVLQSVDAAAEHQAGKPPERAGWIVPAIIGASLLMLTLESTIMANALPRIAGALHEEPLRLNMAMTMFLLASAVFLPISGWMADRFGARKILITSMILFAVSSAGCGLSHSLLQLVASRIFQGASAAMLLPVGRLVLLRTTPRNELVGALSILTIPPMIGPLVGPLLGGFIVTYFNWRWIFFINLPVAVIAVVLVRMFIPDVREDRVAPIDGRGVLLTGVGLACLMFGFENLGRAMLPASAVAGLFAVAFACLLLYGRHARGNPNAVIDLRLFRLRSFAAANVGGAFIRIGMGGLPFLLAMLLQVGFGMSAFAAGALTFLSGTGALFMKGAAPPILRRFGFRRVLLANSAFVALSMAVLAFVTPGTPRWLLMALLASGGFFRSLQSSALSALAFAEVEADEMSRATTATSMAQQLAQPIGIALAAMMLHLLRLARHDTQLVWQAVGPAFGVGAAVGLASLWWFARLPEDAGAELHGRRRG